MKSPANPESSSAPSEGQLAFLHRLAEDDQFRAEVEADPQAKLAEFGLHIDAGDLPARVALPGKAGIRDGLLRKASNPFFFRWHAFLG